MKNYFNSFLLSFLFRFFYLVFISLLVISLGSPIYGTTDDYILSSFIEGSFTGDSEKISIFIEPLISFLIYYMQILLPILNLYSLFLLLILLLSLSIFGVLIDHLNSSMSLSAIWVILASGLTIWFVLNPTYTSASMLGSAINLTSLMILTSRKIKLNNQKFLLIFTSLLFTISYLIRPESGNAVIGIYLLFLIIKITLDLNTRNLIFKNYILVLVTFSFIYALNFVISQNAKTDDWNKYNSWNSMRHQIQQRLPEDKLLNLRTEIDWTVPEYHLFMNLAFGDAKEFNIKWLEPAFTKTKEYRGVTAFLNADKNLIFQKTLESFDKYKYLVFINLAVLILILLVFKFNTFNYLFLLLSLMIIAIVYIYSSVTLHTPNRVIVPLLTMPILLTIYSIAIENIQTRKKFFDTIFYLSTGVFIITLVFIFYNQNSKNAFEISQAKIKNNFLHSFDMSGIFIGPVGTETYHLDSPYIKQSSIKLPIIFTTGNWETFSPHWFKRMEFLGLNKNSLYDNLFYKNVYWISYPQPDNAYLVELYLNEKNYPNFSRKNLNQHETGLAIYQFSEEK